MFNKLNKNKEFNIAVTAKIGFFLILALCVLLYNQGDLTHTIASSFALLNGNILNFYEFNKIAVGGNDYLPFIYFIFAIWFLPFKIIAGIDNYSSNDLQNISWWLTGYQILWGKLLLTLTMFMTAVVISKIFKYKNFEHKSSEANADFITNIIVIFSCLIFSGYDIFSVFFQTLGLLFLIKGRTLLFSVCFSAAISLKYFALIPYLPILILFEKQPKRIVLNILVAISFTFFQFLFYMHSEIFNNNILNLLFSKVGGAGGKSILLKIICLIAYISTLFYAFKKRTANTNEMITISLISTFVYFLMFSAVVWHPQWLILSMPFIVIYFNMVGLKYKCIVNIVGGVCYILSVTLIWQYNVDIDMVTRGPLNSLLSYPLLIMADYYGNSLLKFTLPITYLYLISPIMHYFFVIVLRKYSIK